MIEVYKIVSGKYDSAITPTLIISDTHKTRGNDLRLQKSRLKYDMHKFYFANRVVDHNWVVTANNSKIFKNDLINIGNIRILYLGYRVHVRLAVPLPSPVWDLNRI